MAGKQQWYVATVILDVTVTAEGHGTALAQAEKILAPVTAGEDGASVRVVQSSVRPA